MTPTQHENISLESGDGPPRKQPRWFNSSPLFGSFPTFGPQVDSDEGVLRNVAVTQVGEALGHGVQLDRQFVAETVALGQTFAKGVKVRFGHPTASGSAIGDYLGRATNFRVDSQNLDVARCDIFLDEIANESPRGRLKDYVLQMAERNPDMFGASIVFTPGELLPAPDDPLEPDNVVEFQGLPVATIDELLAVDLVDDPAANPTGLFSAGTGELIQLSASNQIAAQVTAFLDANPQVVELVERKPEVVDGFLRRFKAYQKRRNEMGNEKKETFTPEPAELVACPVCSEQFGANLAGVLNARIDNLETDERSRGDIVDEMGEEAGISPDTVRQILSGDLNCPPVDRLEGFARALDISVESLITAAESDGCEYGSNENGEESEKMETHQEETTQGADDNTVDRAELSRIAEEFGPDVLAEAVREEYTYEEALAAHARALAERVIELEADVAASTNTNDDGGPDPVSFTAGDDGDVTDNPQYRATLNASGNEGTARFAAGLKLNR